MKKEKFAYEFRDDKLERAEAAKFNIEASKRILLLAGITEDNPDYKRYFALTAINVHSTFLYGTYSDSVEEMFVETLKNRDMTIEQYEKVTRDYYNKIVEFQQSNAVGGFGGDKSYDFLKSTIDNTVLSGIDIRKKLNPRFPKEFYDEDGKLRPRIVVEIPYEQQEASALGMIEHYASRHNGIGFDRESNSVLVNGKPVGPEKFFKNKKEFLYDKFLGKLNKDKDLLDMEDDELFDILRRGSYQDFLELKKKRGMVRDDKNASLRGAIADECIFIDLQERMEIVTDRETFLHQIKDLSYDYEAKAHLVRIEAEKDTLEVIDRIVFSVSPYDIATQSTFRLWKSCMNAGGVNHRYVDDAIGMGSIVAYGYDSQNPRMMLSRLLIQPYENDRGEMAYKVNPRIYGHENIGFRNVVNDITSSYFNEGKEGYFIYNRNKPSDVEGYLYNDGGTEPFFIALPDENGLLDLTRFEDVFDFIMSKVEISDVRKVKSEGKVILNSDGVDNIDFSEVEVLVLDDVFELGKGVIIPDHILAKRMLPNEFDFREVEQMEVVNRIFFRENDLLPKKIKVLPETTIEGRFPSCLEFDENGKYEIRNIQTSDGVVCILGDVECSGIIKPEIDFRKANSVTFNNVRRINEGTKLCEAVVCKNIVPSNINFDGVSELVFENVDYCGEGINLPNEVVLKRRAGGDFSEFGKITLDECYGSDITDFPKVVELKNMSFYYMEDSKLYDTKFEHLILNNVHYMEKIRGAKRVTSIGKVPEGGDLSNAELLVLKGDMEFGKDAILPQNVEFENVKAISGYIPQGLDFSSLDEIILKDIKHIGANVKLPKKVIIEGEIADGVDLSDFEGSVVLRGVKIIGENVRLPKVVELDGRRGFEEEKFYGVEKVIIRDNTYIPNDAKFPKYVMYEADECNLSTRAVINTLETNAKKIKTVPKNVENLIFTEKEIYFDERCSLPRNVSFVEGVIISGNVQGELDLRDVKDLTLKDFHIDQYVTLPSAVNIAGKSEIDADISHIEELVLSGSIKLGRDSKLPENVKFEDDLVLSGYIPDGVDLSDAKGLVLRGEVDLGEGVKLPKDVRFDDELILRGNIPQNADLSEVQNLVLSNSVKFGDDVKLPEDVKFKSNSGVCILSGYIPKEADLTRVDLDKVCYLDAILSGDIPDGVDLTDCSGIKLVGDVRFGKNVKTNYVTFEDCSEARFLGDVVVKNKMMSADFSEATSVEFDEYIEFGADFKGPKNKNAHFNGVVITTDIKGLEKLSEYNTDDALVCYCGEVPKGYEFPDNISKLAIVDMEQGDMLIVLNDENHTQDVEKIKVIIDEMVNKNKINARIVGRKEFCEEFGVSFSDMGKKERKGNMKAMPNIKNMDFER